VGKTRLVGEAMARARADGARVLTGGCVELGGDGLPFAPLVDALRALARTTDDEQLDAFLGPARSELARLLPELDPEASLVRTDGDSATARLFELILGVIGRLAADRPLMFVVEDLHWADRSTLDLFAFLVRVLPAGAVLLVGTFRSDELHRRHPLRPLLASLERVRSVQRIDLQPFTRAEVDEQLTAILGHRADPGLVELVAERSEGNAFLVEEILGIARSGGDIDRLPQSLRDVLLARAEQLAPAVHQVVRTVAVAGRRVPDRLLAAVAGLPDDDLHGALRQAVEHQVLVVDESGYAFRHALVRDAVYDDMLPAERMRTHVAYGEAVEKRPQLAGDEGSAIEALAHHWYAAHDLPRALPAAIGAARHAIAAYAAVDAERHLERALEIWAQVPDAAQRAGLDHLGVLELAINAALAAGHERRALPLADAALEEVDRESDPARAALLLERRAEALRWIGRGEEGLADLERAAALADADPPTAEMAIVLTALANAHLLRSGDLTATREIAERGARAARAVGDLRREAAALITLGGTLWSEGRFDDGMRVLEEARRIAEELGDPVLTLRAVGNLSDALELLGRHEAAHEQAMQGLTLSREVGMSRKYGGLLAYNAAEPLVRLGRWEEASRVVDEGARLAPADGRLDPLDLLRAAIAVARGDLDAAAQCVERARPFATGDVQHASDLAAVEVELNVARGDLQAAREQAARALDDPDIAAAERFCWRLVWLASRAEADAATRARDHREPDDRAQARVQELAALAARLPQQTPANRGYAELAVAEQARAMGDPAAGHWEAAAASRLAAGEPYFAAYALLRLAEARLAGGDRQAAADAARQAASLAREVGATPVADEAHALARRGRLDIRDGAGGVTPAPSTDDRFGLTDREREVLRLVADGRSNAQIGAELFISPKTASVHVSNIIAKLGVSGRVEAAAVAHRLGLVAPAGAPE
jgi:DNA-binding CsgD family transcriptional regulator